MRIRNREIGVNSKPFIVAEMSGNHNQSLEKALQIVDAAADALEAMDLALDHTASESRVLDGLSKIAGSLRAKGEAFAADVVEATALSIRGDLRKDAGRRATVVSGLKKLASEFYSSQDTLAGDMVAVTIKKLG